MKVQRTIFTAAVVGLASAGAYAQKSPAELQQAAEQAQAAAAQAIKAAQQAQQAAEQAQAALGQAQQAAAKANPSTPAPAAGEASGLTYQKGADSVSLYGLIEVTAGHKNNANAAGKSLTSFQTAWFSANRWGLTGKHEMAGAGVKAIFKLESEFDYQTGAMDTPNVLFNRDAWLGLESDALGKLTFGRQNTLARDFSGSYGDPYGRAKVGLGEGGYTNNNNFKQLIFYSGSATGTRYDRGIVWKKKFDNLVAGLGYQFGGIPGDFNSGSTKSAALAYNADRFTLAGFLNTANVAGLTHRSSSLGGNYQLSPLVRLNAGYFHYTADQAAALGQRKDNAWTLSAKFTPQGKFDYELGYQVMSADHAAVNASGYVLNAFANAGTATAAVTGKRKTLYGSAFYRFDKSTDAYVAFDRLLTTGGYLAAQANGAKSQNEVAVGMRYRF